MTPLAGKPSVSVVVATYNWPSALNLVIRSLMGQTDRDFEIVVADDGSSEETTRLLTDLAGQADLSIRHLWQRDEGFRKTRILNEAIAESRGQYLIFLDGDCVPQSDFIARHRQLARPSFLVTGSRILVGERLSAELCDRGDVDFQMLRRKALVYRLKGQISKIAPFFVSLPDGRFRDYRNFTWRRIKGCNLGCWKKDAVRVGGFDEGLTGWGHEDVDFVFRMYQAGVDRRSGTWATEVLHLWHKMADRGKAETNRQFVLERIRTAGARGGPAR